MKRLLIVGREFSATVRKIETLGHDYVVLKDKRYARKDEIDDPRYFIASFESRDSIVEAAHKLPPVDGVIWIYENYVLPAAWVAHELGLHGMPIESAEACTDKYLMRSLFRDAPEPISPDFTIANSEEAITKFASSHSFPLILKPANLVKSLLVTKNDDLDELLANYKKTKSQIASVYAKYAPHRKPKLIIEEFLEGRVYSVDAFVSGDGEPHVLENIVDYQTGHDIGFNDNFHYSRVIPSSLKKSDQEAIRQCAALGMKALGMRNSPAHVEIIMTNSGPRIVEIGARNGGYRERIHRIANGIDIAKNAVSVALNETPEISPTRNDSCAVLELFPKKTGIFKGIKNEENLRALSSCQYVSIKQELGNYVGKSADGYKMCAVILLHNEDSEQFKRDLSFVNEHVSVLIDND